MIKVSEACAWTEGNATELVIAAVPVVKQIPSLKWIWKVNMKALFCSHMKQKWCLFNIPHSTRASTHNGKQQQPEAYGKETDSPKPQPPPSNSEELTCSLTIAHNVWKVGISGIHSLMLSSLKTQVWLNWFLSQKKKKKESPYPKITINSVCVRNLTIVNMTMFTVS